jgi:hypothetical protein
MSELFRTLLPGDEAIDQQRDGGAGGVVRVNGRLRDFVAGLPVKESESVQLGAGTGE